MRSGEEIHLIDGKGNFYKGILSEVNEKKCLATITSGPLEQSQRKYHLHLAIAPTKNIDRMEWLVEKSVEIGIDEISFIRCKNSERTVVKTDRLQKIAESAVKQSLQARIPMINELCDLTKILSLKPDLKLIAHCEQGDKQLLNSIHIRDKKSLVLIGPEGDFTTEEIAMAANNNFIPISLGDNRLRTETAGLYVCNSFALLGN